MVRSPYSFRSSSISSQYLPLSRPPHITFNDRKASQYHHHSPLSLLLDSLSPLNKETPSLRSHPATSLPDSDQFSIILLPQPKLHILETLRPSILRSSPRIHLSLPFFCPELKSITPVSPLLRPLQFLPHHSLRLVASLFHHRRRVSNANGEISPLRNVSLYHFGHRSDFICSGMDDDGWLLAGKIPVCFDVVEGSGRGCGK